MTNRKIYEWSKNGLMSKTVNILGTKYTIERKNYKDDPAFEKRSIDGYCDGRLKKIVHCDMTTYPNFANEPKEYADLCEKETLRHEIVHAFFDESGLRENSACYTGGWSQNEEMVDWIAIQFPKIFKVFQELDIME